jgi:alkyl hydroperoxide reductase subunit AhpC
MLTVGENFPAFELTAVVSSDLKSAFETVTDKSYAGKWKVYFFWPKDFTFVCPTEIAAFGKANKDFADRDAQILGASIDSEFVHHGVAQQPPGSEGPAIPHALRFEARTLCAVGHSGCQGRREPARNVHRRS